MISKLFGTEAPLLRRFVASVMLLSIIGGLVISIVIATAKLNHLNTEKEQAARLQLENILDSAAYAAFNLDSAQGLSLLKGFEGDHLFQAVIIFDNYEDVVASIEQPSEEEHLTGWMHYLLPVHENFTLSYPLSFKIYRDSQFVDQHVGNLIGKVSFHTSESEFYDLVSTICLSTMVEVLLIAIILSIFFHNQIGRPLTKIIHSIEKNAKLERQKNARPLEINGHENDEFGLLVNAYNNSVQQAVNYMRELECAKAELKALSEIDPLTNVSNRRALLAELNTLCNNEHPFALVSLDIDYFGGYNDANGHQAGDILLVRFANVLKQHLPQASISRTGGDEFVCIIPSLCHHQSVEDMLMPLLNIAAKEDAVSTPWLSTSIGVAFFPENGHTPRQLLHATDIALYIAKEAGRRCIRFYDKDADIARSNREAVRKALQRIIETKEFTLYYQPKVSMKTGLVTGCEALLRLNHNERQQSVAHVDIVEEAERTGLIVALGREIMRRAFLDISQVMERLPDDFRFSVNVSPQQLTSEGFIAELLSCSEDNDVPLQSLDIEITESSQMINTDSTYKVRNWLKNAGVTVSLDDFGTGFASLEYLLTYGFDQIKIDRQFTQVLPGDDDAKAIFNVVKYLADKLDMAVIAEGVETLDQETYLLNQGFELAQGYFYAKPLAIEDFMRFVASRQAKHSSCLDS
ncbi:EAL domain-containing protein [Grimontia sp. NTOU-MAR1]|uniref:EAL domain-containing protein n=1 Tax=Grimontia sp. NTOU-MAR1 TaxID=3111011 RepID=UPI002DB98AC6|nr:EAL domain-containing protein [Grimontia sp. NTOU-MAR1]WRW00648.1 EAL domain-containing protein [Grimontia sp. NTOU-MAR1]